jgi:SpoVK/Ycf46/Vps4 family AAA+-type ATPase
LSISSLIFALQLAYLSSDEITGGYSGAELIAICRDAALFAIEEEEEAKSGKPMVAMRHLLKSVNGTRKQVTSDIIQFYERFRRL